jgi:hypothetical protein
MVNSSTNINKTNNQLLPQALNIEKIMTYDVGNLGHSLGQTQKLFCLICYENYLNVILRRLKIKCGTTNIILKSSTVMLFNLIRRHDKVFFILFTCTFLYMKIKLFTLNTIHTLLVFILFIKKTIRHI